MRVLAYSLILVVAAPAALSHPLGLHVVPLRGLLEPDGPVVSEGFAATESRQQLLANWTLDPTQVTSTLPTYNGTGFFATVWEWKWHSIQDPATRRDTKLPGFETSDVHSVYMQDPVMRFIGTGRSATWMVTSSYQSDGNLSLGPNAHCDLRPERAVPIDYHRLRPPEYSPNISPQGAPTMVDADCTTDSLSAYGQKSFYFYDAELYFDYLDHDTLGQPVSRQLDAVLGSFVAQNRSAPPGLPVYDHVERMLSLWLYDEHSVFTVPGRMHVDVKTPAFTAGGVVRIPNSRGDLAWGDWRSPHGIQPLAPEGVFRVGAAPQKLAIQGDTVNGPPSAARTRGAPFVSAPVAVAGGLALLALVAAAVSPWGRALLMGLFTRLDKEDALSHGRRGAILEYVRGQPGVQVQAMAEALGIPRGALRYHVAVLARQGLLMHRRFGRTTALFVTGSVSWRDQAARHRASHPMVRSILARLESSPTPSQTEIASSVGVSQPYISRILRSLSRLGLVSKEGHGPNCVYRVRPSPAPATAPLCGPDAAVPPAGGRAAVGPRVETL